METTLTTVNTPVTTAVTMVTNQVAKPQRGIAKKKIKKRTSLEDDENNDIQNSLGSNVVPIKQWIERYEEAVTNHYSPELRAKISSIKVNDEVHELKQCNVTTTVSKKYRLSVQSNNVRFLVATMFLPANTPVLELRGKYMLSTQHKATYTTQNRQNFQRPGPFIFFYRIPRDGIEICVDTRTYGNDARFVRRSCKPNAEVKHCIEKGTLHLYIVTSMSIEKNTEITIQHDQYDLLFTSNCKLSQTQFSCACKNLKNCQFKNFYLDVDKKENNSLPENNEKPEKRRKNKRTTNEKESDTSFTITTHQKSNEVMLPTDANLNGMSLSTKKNTNNNKLRENIYIDNKNIASDNNNYQESDCSINSFNNTFLVKHQPTNEESPQFPTMLEDQSPPNFTYLSNKNSVPHTSVKESNTFNEKKDKKKLTREERKMEAIMKAFERLEKAEQKNKKCRLEMLNVKNLVERIAIMTII